AFYCSARAAEAPPPPPPPDNKPVEAKPVTATVNKQSDVYGAAGGDRIEEPFFLDVRRSLETVPPRTDWCLLKIPDLPGGAHGALPAGQGWVYAADGFLTVK